MSRTRPTRWEYETLRPSRGETKKEAEDPLDALNARGADGWELAGTIEYTGGGTKFLVFKRPVKGDGGPADGDDDADEE